MKTIVRLISLTCILAMLSANSMHAQSTGSGAKKKKKGSSPQSSSAARKASRRNRDPWRNRSPYYQDMPDWAAKAFLPRER